MFQLKYIYWFFEYLFYPIEILWQFLFEIPIDVTPYQTIFITGTAGGSGKTTMAKSMSPDYPIISLDKCKFGDNWKRHTFIEYTQIFENEMNKTNDKYVIESIFSDPKLPEQLSHNMSLMEDCDLVIWNDIPFLICIWRKTFRSFKRWIGVEPQGVSKETFQSVIAMVNKTVNIFHKRWQLLDLFWNIQMKKEQHESKFHRAQWPFYFSIKKQNV